MKKIIDDIFSFLKENPDNIFLTLIYAVLGNTFIATFHSYWLIALIAIVYGVVYGGLTCWWERKFAYEGNLYFCTFLLFNLTATIIVWDKRLLAVLILATLSSWFVYMAYLLFILLKYGCPDKDKPPVDVLEEIVFKVRG
ncbi:hypothetical protein KKA15_02125 [Patescibacteria group bacterium]|nr:hypothetical protein [Patescibacteria group bacterium]